MTRLAHFAVLCAVCSGCASRQAVPQKAAAPQEVVFAEGRLKTVVPGPTWTGVKDSRITDGEIVTYYGLLLSNADGAEIGLKLYPAASASVLMMADHLRDALSRLNESRLEELDYAPENEDRASFRYTYFDGSSTMAGKVAVVRFGDDLGVVIVGTWPSGSTGDAAAFEAVIAALARATR
ncbi:MAG TPA: hypothetical protein VL500_07730 [Candidatus Eisenbacteria bacterium]|jgi:hypothetical protein|nr:hypothetical protein [Candidatus Eisenbacteria bacterium]